MINKGVRLTAGLLVAALLVTTVPTEVFAGQTVESTNYITGTSYSFSAGAHSAIGETVVLEDATEDELYAGVEENEANARAYEESINLNNVEVSEATKKFVADVASVEFSSPSLVDVSKVTESTTVGQIRKSRGLEVEYSAELTEEQITEINAQTVEAGDWVLISMHAFDTEETD